MVYGYFDMLTRFVVEAGRWEGAAKIPVLVSSEDFVAVTLQLAGKKELLGELASKVRAVGEKPLRID